MDLQSITCSLRFHHSFGRTLKLVTSSHYRRTVIMHPVTTTNSTMTTHEQQQWAEMTTATECIFISGISIGQMMASMRGVVCMTTINRVGVGCWLQVLVVVNGGGGGGGKGVGATTIKREFWIICIMIQLPVVFHARHELIRS